MKTISALALAALFASLVVGSPARAFPRSAAYCADGYHADLQGNCQPNGGVVDSRCPPGYETQPFPNGQGYRCVPY